MDMGGLTLTLPGLPASPGNWPFCCLISAAYIMTCFDAYINQLCFEKMLQYFDMCAIMRAMNRVKYEYSTPTTFEEHLHFTKDAPYILRIKRFIHEDVVPLHYGKTIEILLAQDLEGKIVVGNQSYPLKGRQLFVVPPNTIHANDILPGDGTLYVLKMDFDVFAEFANISAILENHNTGIANLAHYYTGEDCDRVFSIIMDLVQYDSDFSYCIGLIIQLFSVLKDRSESVKPKQLVGKYSRDIDLHELIRWTQNNLSRKITLQEVADRFGYSKCYFCSSFKRKTGFTYYEYLTSTRISYACQLLLLNKSVKEVCYMAGFENVSYFVQMFKKNQGVTPKEYARAYASISPTESTLPPGINGSPD